MTIITAFDKPLLLLTSLHCILCRSSCYFNPNFSISLVPVNKAGNYRCGNQHPHRLCDGLLTTTTTTTTRSHRKAKTNDNNDHPLPMPPPSSLRDGIRLNKVFKATHSRREADKLIASGRVSVNGKPVLEKGGFVVIPFKDVVELDGKVIKGWESMNAISIAGSNDNDNTNTNLQLKKGGKKQQRRDTQFEYVKYWKPLGVICTTDSRIKGNIIESIKRNGFSPKHRIYPVGRLDKETSGLIILTSDGRLPNAVLRGEKKQPKVYDVVVDRPISERGLQKLRDGIVITTVAQRDGRSAQPLTQRTKPCHIQRHGPQSFQITLVEGRNRQIRKMVSALNYEVVALQRTDFMGIHLERGVNPLQRPGDWKVLDVEEMRLVERALRLAAGD